jgi:hypothetical protein
MPWKNGGGTTSEVLVEPPEGRFRYRVSIADVASDGPFSRFEGYDRHILLLDGAGMTLDAGEHGAIALAPYAPRAFSGDWAVTGTLTAGPVRDFNLIVDRAWAESSLTVETLVAPVRYEADVCILHVLEGADVGDTFVAEGALDYAGPARVVVARLRRTRAR